MDKNKKEKLVRKIAEEAEELITNRLAEAGIFGNRQYDMAIEIGEILSYSDGTDNT